MNINNMCDSYFSDNSKLSKCRGIVTKERWKQSNINITMGKKQTVLHFLIFKGMIRTFLVIYLS